MDELIICIWGGASLLVFFIHLFYAGFMKSEHCDEYYISRDRENMILRGLFGGMLWPIIVAGLLIYAPCWLIFRLGKLVGGWHKMSSDS